MCLSDTVGCKRLRSVPCLKPIVCIKNELAKMAAGLDCIPRRAWRVPRSRDRVLQNSKKWHLQRLQERSEEESVRRESVNMVYEQLEACRPLADFCSIRSLIRKSSEHVSHVLFVHNVVIALSHSK